MTSLDSYITLGRSGLRVSPLTLGTMTFGEDSGWGASPETSEAILAEYLDRGGNVVDTANIYTNGHSEKIVGDFFAARPGLRERVVLSTKFFANLYPGDPNGGGGGRKALIAQLEESLRRLQTDYVDLYQAHRYDYSTPLEETMQAFADVVRSGKALYIGVSEWTASEIRAGWEMAQDLKIPFVSNQPQYSMLWRVIEAEVVPASIELGLGQVVFSPIAQGVLTGKYQPGGAPPEGSRATAAGGADFIQRWLRDDVLSAVARLAPLAEQAGLSLGQLAVAWVLQNDNVSAAIVGASRPEQIRDNVKASGVRLDGDLMKAIDDILDPVTERDPAKTVSPARRP